MISEFAKPNWDHWSLLDGWTLEVVICLSINISPTMDFLDNLDTKSGIGQKFIERSKYFLNLRTRLSFMEEPKNDCKDLKSFIDFSDFARIANYASWDLPCGFPKLPVWQRSPPDWKKWRQMDIVTIKTALLLSLNLNPERNNIATIELWKKEYPDRITVEFRDRYEIIVSNKLKLNIRETGNSNFLQQTVHLFEFQKLTRILGWDLPDEFPRKPPENAISEMPYYIPPYLKFMNSVAENLKLEPNDNRSKKKIEEFLITNWPEGFGQATTKNNEPSNKVKNMATFLRRPDQERGGQN